MKHEEISYRTKKALAEALKARMQKEPFQKITVSDLIRDTDMNRKTFYYHFADIYALLKWMLEEEAVGVVKQFDLLVDYEEAITFVMDYVEENDHIINCAFDAIGRVELQRFFWTDFHEIVVSIVERAEQRAGKTLDAAYREFLTQFYMDALVGMLMDWVCNRSQRDRKTVLEHLSKTIWNSLLGILAAE